ncbi:MAG: hypothetical protein ABJO01_15110 [Parasphingorhabdus sp.]|uniref:hypothetical protein n=1 Tax=Parasphingorhabdus sp. TaxID=2709688 RepID=UPI00329714F5
MPKLQEKFPAASKRKYQVLDMISIIILAILIMILFIPVAIGFALYIIVPDWFQAHRNQVIIGVGLADFILFAALIILFFGFV